VEHVVSRSDHLNVGEIQRIRKASQLEKEQD